MHRTLIAVAFALIGTHAAAAYHDRGPTMVYDDEKDISWSKATPNTGPHMTYDGGAAFADQLTVAFEGQTFTDWSLPDALANPVAPFASPPGFAWTGVPYPLPVGNSVLTPDGYVVNDGGIWPPRLVWSVALGPSSFGLLPAVAEYLGPGVPYHQTGAAWAMRHGDVLPVPEPATYALALVGLTMLLVVRARRPEWQSVVV